MRQLPGDTIAIRFSEMKDVRELIMLDNEIWDETTTPGPLAWRSREDYLLHSPPGSQLVAISRDEVCGYVGFACPSGMESNRHVYEMHIAVHPDWQRQGVGYRPTDALAALARSRGIRKLRARVLSSNEGALSFYSRTGFREEGRLKEEYRLQDRYIDEVFMAKVL